MLPFPSVRYRTMRTPVLLVMRSVGIVNVTVSLPAAEVYESAPPTRIEPTAERCTCPKVSVHS